MAPDWPARSVVFQPGGSVEVAWRDRDLTLDIRGTVRIIAEGTLDVPEGSRLVAAARADR